jgi:hypothetical protein
MDKVKYYQIAFKGEFPAQEYKRLVSPSLSEIEAMEAGGWVFKSSVNPFPQKDPILDGTTLREKTDEEKQAVADYQFGLQVANLNKCSKLEIRRAMRTLGVEANLDSLLTNEQFAKDWNDATEIELSDQLTLQAITAYNIDVNSVKEQIIINRSL